MCFWNRLFDCNFLGEININIACLIFNCAMLILVKQKQDLNKLCVFVQS